MKRDLRILHLEDDNYDVELVRQIMAREGLAREWVRVDSQEEFTAALERGAFDLILSDYTLPSFNGMDALAIARQKQPNIPFIFVSGTIQEELAIESLKQGAADYVFKSRLSRLGPSVRRALRDVDEREENRRAEEAMRQSEHKYRQVFESMSEAAFLTDAASGRVIDANKQAEQLLGHTRAQILGVNHERFHFPEKFAAYRAVLKEVLEGKAAADVESEIIRKDGTRIPVEIHATQMELYGRRLILGLYCDIAERKRSDEQAREQARLLDLVPDAILVRDMRGRIQFWNEGAVRLYGWPRDEALGRQVNELLYHDQSEFEAANRAILKKGEWEGDLHQVDRKHHELVVHSRWTLVRSENGEPKSVLLVNSGVAAPPERNRLNSRECTPEILHRSDN